jgi:ectoine utilization protein EutC
MSVRILTEAELRDCARLDGRAVDTIAGGFAALHRGEAVMPPVLSMDLAERNAEVDIKTAWMRGLDHFAVKISSGFFNNAALGLPSLSGMMALLDASTGRASAVLLDNGWLTDLRTAAAGAVAARYLARADAATAAIIGTGLQARLQLEALTLVRPIRKALIWGRSVDNARACADDCARALGVEVQAAGDVVAAAQAADIVVTTTPARSPVLPADALHPGLHVTAMGADAPEKNELDPEILRRADIVVCDRQAQCERIGELRSALAAGVFTADARLPEIGAIAAGEHPGREHDPQITVADLTGTGVQDTAIAALALELATERGHGATIETDR